MKLFENVDIVIELKMLPEFCLIASIVCHVKFLLYIFW